MFLIIIIPKICEGSWIPDVKMLSFEIVFILLTVETIFVL